MKKLAFLLFASSVAFAEQNFVVECSHGQAHSYPNFFKGSITVNIEDNGFAEASANLTSSQLVINEQTQKAERVSQEFEISHLTGTHLKIEEGQFAIDEIESITLGSDQEQEQKNDSPKVGLQLSMGSKSVFSTLTVNGAQFTAICKRSLN